MKRNRTTIEFSNENLKFWQSLPSGSGKRLVNFLFDQVREKKDKSGVESLHYFLGKVEEKNIKIVE